MVSCTALSRSEDSCHILVAIRSQGGTEVRGANFGATRHSRTARRYWRAVLDSANPIDDRNGSSLTKRGVTVNAIRSLPGLSAFRF